MSSRPGGALRDHLTPTTPAAADGGSAEPQLSIEQLLDLPETRARIEEALGTKLGIDIDRYLAVLRAAPLEDPLLLTVAPTELLDAYIGCAQLGLEPNGILGHCFLRHVPIPDSHACAVEFILGYKGMIALAHRSPEIEQIEAHVVREKDQWAFEQGTDSYLMHNWDPTAPRGEPIFYYGIARFPGEARPRFWVIDLEEIAQHRAESPTADDPGSLWIKRPVQMALKTVIRIMFPMLPVSADALEAAGRDGTVIGEPEPQVEVEGADVPVPVDA